MRVLLTTAQIFLLLSGLWDTNAVNIYSLAFRSSLIILMFLKIEWHQLFICQWSYTIQKHSILFHPVSSLWTSYKIWYHPLTPSIMYQLQGLNPSFFRKKSACYLKKKRKENKPIFIMKQISLLSFKIQNKNFETDIKRESVGLNVVLLGSM